VIKVKQKNNKNNSNQESFAITEEVVLIDKRKYHVSLTFNNEGNSILETIMNLIEQKENNRQE
jgi:hypothetical protein